MSMWRELSGRNMCLSHGASQSNLMCNFHTISAVSQGDKKVTENDNKNSTSTNTHLRWAPLEGLEDTVVRHENTLVTTRSWLSGAIEEIKPGQNEANSGESCLVSRIKKLEEILGQNVDLSATLPFHPYQALKWLYMNQIAGNSPSPI